MATRNARNGSARLERLAHYCELFVDRAPAALLRLGENFDGFHVVAGLKIG
jgi:hypothetical protein